MDDWVVKSELEDDVRSLKRARFPVRWVSIRAACWNLGDVV